MKRLILASILALGATQASATYLSAISGANGANLTLEDNSREQWVDVDNSGTFNAGDKLTGFLKIDAFNPPGVSANNELYVLFEQTFGGDFAPIFGPPGFTKYVGSFSDVFLEFIDYSGSTDWTTGASSLATGVGPGSLAIDGPDGIRTKGTVAFTAGLVEPEDFFAFETEFLQAGDGLCAKSSAYAYDPNFSRIREFWWGLVSHYS